MVPVTRLHRGIFVVVVPKTQPSKSKWGDTAQLKSWASTKCDRALGLADHEAGNHWLLGIQQERAAQENTRQTRHMQRVGAVGDAACERRPLFVFAYCVGEGQVYLGTHVEVALALSAFKSASTHFTFR